eukprot:gene10033-18667_t
MAAVSSASAKKFSWTSQKNLVGRQGKDLQLSKSQGQAVKMNMKVFLAPVVPMEADQTHQSIASTILPMMVKARVHASMEHFYVVYTHLNQKTGDVMYAKCSCKAGQEGCCKHVAALLFTLVDFANLDTKVIPNDLTSIPTFAEKNTIPQLFGQMNFNVKDSA